MTYERDGVYEVKKYWPNPKILPRWICGTYTEYFVIFHRVTSTGNGYLVDM